MNTVARKTLSIMMVIGLVVGGLPLFFAATDNAEAAVGVWEKRTSAMSIMHSNGKLTVDVSTFEDEGGKPIQGYTMLLKWDACRKDLNPLSGFWRTIRDPQTATITTDAKGEAEYKFSISNGCWTENLWIYGASEEWQNIVYFLGNIASTNIHLDIKTQASMATQHAMQRADTLGLIQDWYQMVPYESSIPDNMLDVVVYGSKIHTGAIRLSVHATPKLGSWAELGNSPTSSVGNIKMFNRLDAGGWNYIRTYDNQFKDSGVKGLFGPHATISGTTDGKVTIPGNTAVDDPYIVKISNAEIFGTKAISTIDGTGFYHQIWVDGRQVAPSTGWTTAKSGSDTRSEIIDFDGAFTMPISGSHDIEYRFYKPTAGAASPDMYLYGPQCAEIIVGDLTSPQSSLSLTLTESISLTVDLTGHWGEWQISGSSSTLTSQDLVPVNAKISSIYPLVISNPRFDKTPIAGAGNGLKFDVYNIKEQATNETIYLSLIADDTTVWSTTVGQREYPAWTNQSQFTTVHLTDISFPAEARREYNLRITSGGAITEIPVVFYPAELDPDVVYEPKEDLDEIIADYGTVNAAALKAYHDWAAAMQPRIEAIKSDVQNYTQLFEDRAAMDKLALADAAATRGLELIIKLKEICKGDGSDTSIGELTSHAQGIWSSYQAALLYREAAISFEAGQDAFGNSTALDAWYQDLVSKRIKTGLDDQRQGDDPNSVAVWVGVAVALVVGGLVMYLAWKYIIPPLRRVLPKGRSPRLRTIRAVTPVAITIVLAVLIALVAFLATWHIALSIEAALR